jgi:DNA-directed RNA polymerase subunit beta
VRDTSMKVPHGESGVVIGVRVFDREEDDELPPVSTSWSASMSRNKRKITQGDKLAGRHGNKGVIAKILPVEDMPFLEDGTPVDIVLNPLGVPGRMNVGQVLETTSAGSPPGWNDRSRTGPNGPARMGARAGRPAEHAGRERRLRRCPRGGDRGSPGERPWSTVTASASWQRGKARLFDGRSGEPFPDPISVGYVYILKLHHLVDDKIHARSTGPYSMITQQPLGGKAQFGGQRFGEMEVWALEAYGAAYALQELLTIKSDDVSAA